ncbi:SAM-dependent methyltransferase [Hyperthermus butylicus]|uniref:Conserved archaeal protein n=1 Tax=Hyperthermus butylicus (strain DSM 5456 / JCM 9403 / PLM1-5) TaxID=415426 RepID=A2BM10_HYPBU|nr:class I SAM-dependent methyltransferase [Hyperthermus butylicus]ABM81021.1 conserved archaeal protein [Hyperthermus butylicus DSM 5456]
MTLFGFNYDYQPSVPWVPTRNEVIEYLVTVLRPKPGDVVYDIGCGDGRVAVTIASKFPHVRVRCVELRRDLVERARKLAEEQGVRGLVDIVEADFFKVDLRDANIVYMYLLTSVNQKLRPKLEHELRIGTLLVSLDFPIPGWNPVATIELERSWQRVFYIYVRGVSDIGTASEAMEEALRSALRRLDLEAARRKGANIVISLPQISK